MTDNLSPLEKARIRELKSLKAEEKATARRQKSQGRTRKLQRENDTRRKFLMGTAIIETEITSEERAVIGGIIKRWDKKPPDFNKLSDFLPIAEPVEDLGEVLPRRPAIVSDGSEKAA